MALALLSIRTRGTTGKLRTAGLAGAIRISSPKVLVGFSSTRSMVAASRASLAGLSNGPPPESCTVKESSAMPFFKVKIRASTMLAPDRASAPASCETRPRQSAT